MYIYIYEIYLVPISSGLVIVPVVADVGDGTARAGVALLRVAPAILRQRLDRRLAVL